MQFPFAKFKKSKSSNSYIGIGSWENKLTAVNVNMDLGVNSYLIAKDNDEELQWQELQQFIVDNQYENSKCCYCLPTKDYLLDLIELPIVPELEMQDAIKPLVKELVSYPIEQAVIDKFELPLPRSDDNATMAYVAVAHQDIVNKIKQRIESLSLNLHAIDIYELSLRNLVAIKKELSSGCLIIPMRASGGELLVMRNRDLYITRKLELSLEVFLQDNESPSQEQIVLDQLALDIQRSMDFCSSMFRSVPVDSIILLPTNLNISPIQEYLAENLDIEVKNFELTEVLNCDIPYSDKPKLLTALGAALYNQG